MRLILNNALILITVRFRATSAPAPLCQSYLRGLCLATKFAHVLIQVLSASDAHVDQVSQQADKGLRSNHCIFGFCVYSLFVSGLHSYSVGLQNDLLHSLIRLGKLLSSSTNRHICFYVRIPRVIWVSINME